LEISRAGASLGLAVALIYSVVLSCWWATFGWDSWGDRLMIPPMLAMIICLTATARERTDLQNPWFLYRRESYAVQCRVIRLLRNGAILAVLLLSLHFTFVSYYANRKGAIMASL
jgi:hypothetical protein